MLFKRKSLYIITVLIFIVLFSTPNIRAKEDANTTWILDDWHNNTYLRVEKIIDDVILLRGVHNTKTSTNYYKTDGFVMTLEPYNINGKFPSSARDNRIFIEKKDFSVTEEETITDYTIKFEDIVSMASKLGISGESIGNGTVPIYLHTVYDIYKGDKRAVNDVIGVQEMIDAPVKYKLGYTA